MVGWLRAVIAILSIAALCPPAAGYAAPARLNDEIPDAVPDPEGLWSFGFGYQGIGLEGPLTDSNSTHSVFRLRYQVSPDANAAVTYGTHSLAGGVGLLHPLFDNQDSASNLGFDLRLNLLNEPSTYETSAEGVDAFVAGSAFDIGVSLERMRLTASALDQDDTLLRAYLAYSTDLSEQLRTHTFFSTGRISGDTHTGSVNRVGAGLDYTLGERLVLMADAVLDVYNFRAPTFNTSRITSFDIGLRYGFSRQLYGSLGWMTYNDSENDASGSGLFAGLQWLSEDPELCAVIEEPFSDEPPATEAAIPPAPAGDVVIEPASAQPEVAAQPELVEPAPTEAPLVVPAPEAPPPAVEAPAVTEPVAEPEQPLVLPDGRAEGPVRERVVSSLQDEFANAPAAPETATFDDPRVGYDPRSWEDLDAPDNAAGTEETVSEDNGVDIPPLGLFPETVQANAGDIRPRLSGVPRGGRSASTIKERAAPKSDDTVVEVEITANPPADG